jgi:hypothetical protein
MGEKRNTQRFLVENLEGKRLFGRPKCLWADDIKMILKEIE